MSKQKRSDLWRWVRIGSTIRLYAPGHIGTQDHARVWDNGEGLIFDPDDKECPDGAIETLDGDTAIDSMAQAERELRSRWLLPIGIIPDRSALKRR